MHAFESLTRLKHRRGDILKGALLFVVLGPPVGSLVFSAMAIGTLVPDDVQTSWKIVSGFEFVAAAFAMSYVYGVIPAALTGMLAGGLRKQLHKPACCLGLCAGGALLSVAIGALYPAPPVPLILAPSAIAGAVVCIGIFRYINLAKA